MSTPFKVIHRYRNNNGRTGFKLYVFLPTVVQNNKPLMSFLERIKKLTFADTLASLNQADVKCLKESWGDRWYLYIFTYHHIVRELVSINKNTKLLTQLTELFSEDWVNNNIRNPNLQTNNPLYANYADYIKFKNAQKLRLKKGIKQTGGFDDDFNDDSNDDEIDPTFDEEDMTADNEDVIELGEVNIKTDEKTQKQINKLTPTNKDIEFDFSKDDFEDQYDDQDIYEVYVKIYIKNYSVYWDDSIYKLKCKIACSIGLPKRFIGNNLIPSRIHMWSHYFDPKGKLDKIMLGSKWTQRGQLVNINPEPDKNPIAYSNMTSANMKDLLFLVEKQGDKLHREDDNGTILYEFKDFITCDEVYICDVYTMLDGVEINKNLINTLIKLYFPIVLPDVNDIIEYFSYIKSGENIEKSSEYKKMYDINTTLRNNLSIENNIVNIIENTSQLPDLRSQIIIQAVMQTFLYFPPQNLPLHEMYNNFVCSHEFPYAHLLLAHEVPQRKVFRYKSVENISEEVTNIQNWFKSVSYGFTVKMRVNNRFISITITDTSRVTIKVQFREEDNTSLDDVYDYTKFVYQFIQKVNSENELSIPEPNKKFWRFVFINSIQKFKLPESKTIDHTVLADICRYFFPYVAVVTETGLRKLADTDEKSIKHGTYLRYKKVSNYGDTNTIQKRIIHYIRNYMISDKQLTRVIHNEFNMVEEEASKIIQHIIKTVTINKKPNLKSASLIKQIRPSGISIEIHGKDVDSYKIRIIGVRSEEQMNTIYTVVTKLLNIYYQLISKKTSQLLKTLENITSLAKRQSLVRDVVIADGVTSSKEQTGSRELDVDNITGNISHYTRQCQNSGNEIRRPKPVTSKKELEKMGYKYDKKSKMYEKTILHPITRKKTVIVALRYVTNDGTEMFYVCDPTIHKERVYIGILSKINPMLPCCFKKNQLQSKNKAIRNKFISYLTNTDNSNQTDEVGNILYIKKYMNFTKPGRLYFLPELLDRWLQKGRIEFRNSRLEKIDDKYLFLYGISGKLLDVLSYINNSSINDLLAQMVEFCKSVKEWLPFFTYLESGMTRLRFNDREAFFKDFDKTHMDNHLLLRDIFCVMKKVNIHILDINDKDLFVRCIPYINKEFSNCIVIVDNNNMWNIVVEGTKTAKSDKLTLESKFKPTHRVSSAINKMRQFSCSLDKSITVDSYDKETFSAQIIDSNFKSCFLINKKDIPFPITPSRCDPFIPISTIVEFPLEQLLKVYRIYPWIRVVTTIFDKDENKFVGIKLEVGFPLFDHELNISIQPLKQLPNELDNTMKDVIYSKSKANDYDRLFATNKEMLREEIFMYFRYILSHRFSMDDKNREYMISEVTSSHVNKQNVIQIILNMLHDVKRLDEDSHKWCKQKESEIVSLRITSKRSKNICSSESWLSKLFCVDNFICLPHDWYDEVILRLTTQLMSLQISGKEILRIDKYRVSEVVDLTGMPEDREETELSIRGYVVDIKSIVRILYGDVATQSLQKVNSYSRENVDERYVIKDYEDYYSQEIMNADEMILRGLVNGIYHLLHRKRYGIDVTNLGATNEVQTRLVNIVKGKAVRWLFNQIGSVPPEITNVVGAITQNTIISFQNDSVPDNRWLFVIWVFHKLFSDIPIWIINSTDKLRYSFEKGDIFEGPRGRNDWANMKDGIILRSAPDKGIPIKIECIYFKD